MQADWRAHLITRGKSGDTLDRGIWEISLAFAVRDALRAGGLFLTQSRHHVSFWNLIYEDPNWQQAREQAYQRLDLPTDGQAFLTKIIAEFERVVQAAEHGLPTNRFATIKGGRLKLKKRDAMPVSRALRALRDLIGASMPKARIEDLLQDVDEGCHFTTAFQPLGGYQPRNPDPYLSLLATLIAHGTNLGLAAMSQSVDTLTADALQDTSRWFLRDATLKAANTILVNHHHGQALSAIWDDGRRSSSDGQRFAVERKSLLGSVYPRYFGTTIVPCNFIPTPPISTASTAPRLSPARRARPATFLVVFSTTIPTWRSLNTPPIPMDLPSICSVFAYYWGSTSCPG